MCQEGQHKIKMVIIVATHFNQKIEKKKKKKKKYIYIYIYKGIHMKKA
jgi:hypothetical protein